MLEIKQYFECDCGDFDHFFRVAYFEDDQDYLYLHIHLRRHNFFKRIVTAIKYVFGYGSKYGDFDEILLDKDRSMSLVNFVNKYIEKQSELDKSTSST